MNDRVRISRHDNGVAEVVLVRSDKMNALDPAMFDALADATQQLKQDRSLRAVVLHGEGRAFCAGLDMASMAGLQGSGEGSAARLLRRDYGIANLAQVVALGWREVPVPVIAAVHGVAFGGGLQVALGADLRLITASTQMSVMESKWGLVPDMAGMVLMRTLVRDDHLRELVYTGRVVAGAEAVALGLATRVCDDPVAEAHTLARQLVLRSPSALRAAKRLLNAGSRVLDDSARELLLAESQEQAALIGGSHQLEAVRAGLEKRDPVFDP